MPVLAASGEAGRSAAGAVIDADLMTYGEVAARMVQLMFVQPAAERPDLEAPHEEPGARIKDKGAESPR